MKTISKRFLKGGLAVLLAVVMLFGSCISGFAAVVDNADTGADVDAAATSVNHSGGYVYFVKPASWTASTLMFCVGHDSYTSCWTMTKLSGNLYYLNLTNAVGSGWNNANYHAVMANSGTWGAGNWGYSNISSNATNYTSKYSNYGFNKGSTYLLTATNTAKGASLTTTYKTNSSTGYTSLNSSQTAYSYAAAAGSSSYSANAAAGKITVNSYALSNNGTGSSSTVTKGDSATSVNRNAAQGTTVTMTATPADGYNFVGWFTSTSATTATSTSTTYTYECTGSAKSMYARFQQAGYSYTVTAGEGGTITSATSGTATSATITASPSTGYNFAGWEVTGNGSVDNASAASTTLTINANGVVAHATFAKKTYTVKFTDINGNQIGSDQTVEHGDTPTAPSAPAVTGKTFAGWSPAVDAVTSDTTYQATYTDNTYSITVNQTGGTGTVNLGKTSAKYGDTVTLSVTPPNNYKISSITGGGLNVGECESYNGSFTMPASNVTITVNYVQAGTCGLNFALGDQTLNLGATVTNTATANAFCSGGTISYKSSDTTVATVDASTGLVTAKKPGTTTITATCSKDKTTATYTVTVKDPSVTVPPMTLAVNANGTAEPTITDGPASGYTITYSDSSDYFNVSADGTVTAIKPGSGTVSYTMTYGGNTVATGSFNVTVNTPAFSILPLTDNLIVGQTMTADFETTSDPAAQSVTLESADASKVTISGKKATAVAAAPEGVTITAAFKFNDSYTAYATAKVIVAEPEITANPTSVALEFGGGTTSSTVTLDTNAAAGNGTGDNITVQTANANVATATLSGNKITITATGTGSTTVTAKFHDAEVEIPVTVTQYDPYVYLYVTDNNGWDSMYVYSWKGSNTVVTPITTSMIYIGKNGDNQKIFAYRFLKTNLPENVIFAKNSSWGSQTADTAINWNNSNHRAFYFASNSDRSTMNDWTSNCMIVRPTVSVADVVVPVAQTETATATVTNGDKILWSMTDETIATVADVATQTATVTGVAPGETTISARAFVDESESSIKHLPTNYKTDTACWPFISTEATATVTVGSVDYTVNVNAQYSNDGTNYVDGTTGGTVRATKSQEEGYEELTLPAQISHGKTIEVGATAKSGYRFVGWYKNNNFTTSVGTSTDHITSAITADTTYTARFVKTHQVTVNFTDGIESIRFNNVSYNDSFNNITVDAGASITVYATPEEGYKFTNWTVVGATVADNTALNLTVSNIQSSITLTANAVPVYTASATAQTNKYFGTYGGTVTIDGQSSPVQYEEDEFVTFEAHNNTNYYFAGWYSDAEFTTLVDSNATYETTMPEDGITLYALFVKQFYLTSSTDEKLAEFVYNVDENSYSVTTDFTDHFTLTSNDNNDVTNADVNVTGGTHTGCTVAGHYTSYQVTPDTENYDIESPVTYTLTPDLNSSGVADGTYTMNITLQEAEKVEISLNGTKIADKAIGSTFEYEITAPAGQYLLSATITPNTSFEIVDGKIKFTVPNTAVNIVPTFANYSYVEFSNETTGLDITGLKNGYKAGEAVTITVTPTSEQVTISDIVADNAAAVITKNGDNWTVTIASMPADTTITLTTTVDAKFKMDYGMVAIGNYGSGYTTYGTVAMNIDGTALSKGGYVDKTETVTYTATPNTNFIFDGWYSGESCETSQLLSRETSYDVTPTEDTTIYALFVPKHYIAEDQANVSSHQEMTYDPATRTFHYSSSTISKSAWFRVSNRPETSYWTDSSSYCIFDSSFNVTFNANAYMVTVGWGTQCYALTSDSSAEHPYEIIVALNGNSSIDVSCKAAVDGIGSVFLSSGRGDIVEATSIFTTEGITAVDKNAHHDGTADSIHESYKVANLQEPQTVSFETELTGVNAGNYYIDRYVVYHVNTETYTLITPNTLGNNKYSGTVYVDGPCYIVPIYFLTPEYTAANGLVEIDIYFDATAIKDKNWGPFVACYAWGSNNTKYTGGWSGQLMIPNEDGSSFYTMIAVPDGVTNESSVPNGVTFNNYMQATVPGHNAGAFGISATQYQCYDYREPITLYEEGYDVITFVAKESTDGYHGDRANGVTVNTVTASTTDIFNKYDFDYLYNRNSDVPMDLNGDDIENPVNISVARADYYIIAKGDITYDPNGTKYTADPAFDADWAVDWYVFDSNGTYVTNILSDAMYNEYADDGTTFLENALGLTAAQAAGKTIAISYDHENNAGHQISYDGQWYGNMLDDDVYADVMVGLVDANDNFVIDTVDPTNDAVYGGGWIVAQEEREGYTVGEKYASLPISLDLGTVSLTAATKEGYLFVGWYTESNGKYTKISDAYDYETYINMNGTYYAMFREIGEGQVVINHLKYDNPTDTVIPSHGGMATMTVEVMDSGGNVLSSGAPSTDISTAVFPATENETYTITITTTPLMNGEFFAWYTDSFDDAGNKTFEEIGTDGEDVGSTETVTFTYEFTFENDSPTVINLYSDVTRVTNKADFYYRYLNRYGEWRTYTVRDIELSDEECLGYEGNENNAYYPTYLTKYYYDDGSFSYGKTPVSGKTEINTENKIQRYAPNADVTEVFDGTVSWSVESATITPGKSIITIIADQGKPEYTITYEMGDETGTVTGVYNTLVDDIKPIVAPSEYNGLTFSYWVEIDPVTSEETFLSYQKNYSYRIVENKNIKAIYGVANVPDWTPSIDSVTYTREFSDSSDVIYTDFLLAFNSKNGLKLNEVKIEQNIKYGLIMVQDPNESYDGPGDELIFPEYNELNLKKSALAGRNGLIGGNRYYNFDLTNLELTNFNRCDYFKSYDNNDTTNNFKSVAYTCVAYMNVDGTVYLSSPQYVNFYDLATTDYSSVK